MLLQYDIIGIKDLGEISVEKQLLFFKAFLVCIFTFAIFILGIFIKHDYDTKAQTDSYTEAKRIENIETRNKDGKIYKHYFYFDVDGKEYEHKTSVSSSERNIKETKVYYNSQNPDICITEYELANLVIFEIAAGLLGVFDVLCILFICFTVFRRNSLRNKLKISGVLLKDCEYIKEHTNIQINGRPVYKLVVNYTMENGQKYTFSCRKIANDITSCKIDVIYNPQNLKEYMMDFNLNL